MIGQDILQQAYQLRKADPSPDADEAYTALIRTLGQFRGTTQQIILQAQKAIATYDQKRQKQRQAEVERKRKLMAVYRGNPYSRN